MFRWLLNSRSVPYLPVQTRPETANMAEVMTDDSRWVNGVAARLRVLQANFADAQPAVRQGYLVEEIERALKQLPFNRRKPCLFSLAEQFPAWQGASEPAPVSGSKPETAEDLLERFIEMTVA